MNLNSATEWIAWGGIVLPLIGMSWAAIQYVLNEKRKVQCKRYSEFSSLLGEVNSGILTKQIGAIYELRKYPEYKEVTGRILSQIDIRGTAADLLTNEMDITLSELGLKKRVKK